MLGNFMGAGDAPGGGAVSADELGEEPIEPGAKLASRVRHVIFQTAESVVPKELFEERLRLIDALRPRPAPTQELRRSDALSRRAECVRMALPVPIPGCLGNVGFNGWGVWLPGNSENRYYSRQIGSIREISM